MNTALKFNGGVADLSGISLSNTFSISLWLNPDNVSGVYEALLNSHQDLGLFFITGHAWGSACDFQASFYSYGDNGMSPVMSAGSWHHLVLSVDNGTGTWYVDNVVGDTLSYGIPSWTVYKLGNDPIGECLYGAMDDVVVFEGKALSAGDVDTIWNAGNGKYADLSLAPFDSNVVAGWHFDEGSGTEVYDIGGVHTGTLSGDVTFVEGKVVPPAPPIIPKTEVVGCTIQGCTIS